MERFRERKVQRGTCKLTARGGALLADALLSAAHQTKGPVWARQTESDNGASTPPACYFCPCWASGLARGPGAFIEQRRERRDLGAGLETEAAREGHVETPWCVSTR